MEQIHISITDDENNNDETTDSSLISSIIDTIISSIENPHSVSHIPLSPFINTNGLHNSITTEIIHTPDISFNVFKRTRDTDDLLLSMEPSKKKHFHIGFSRTLNYKPLKRVKVKRKIKSKTKVKSKIDEQHEPIETLFDKEARLLKLVTKYNPIYSRRKIIEILKRTEVKYDFTGKTKPGIIKIIIPNMAKNFMDHLAYFNIGYKQQRYFEWCIWLEDLINLFPKNQKNPIINDNDKDILDKNDMLIIKIKDIYYHNQRVRWAFKNLYRLWLIKKCNKRTIGDDRDLITFEPITKDNMVSIICLKTRSKYVFSSFSIIKTIQSSLETQLGGISVCLTPKNPYTHVHLTFCQMLEIYNQILIICSKKGKYIPSIVVAYREINFNTLRLSKIQNNYLQYKATIALIYDNDTNNAFFLENLAILLDTYSMLSTEYGDTIVTIARFKIWAKFEPKNPLIIMWKQLICDYWYYEQTTILLRDSWRVSDDMITDIVVLLRESETKLRNIYNEYKIRPFLG